MEWHPFFLGHVIISKRIAVTFKLNMIKIIYNRALNTTWVMQFNAYFNSKFIGVWFKVPPL